MMGRYFFLALLGSALLLLSGAVLASPADGTRHIIIGSVGALVGGVASGRVASVTDKADRAEGGEDEDE